MEERKDNAQRRLITNVIAAFLIGATVVALAIGIVSVNDSTREWAQNIVTILIGGFVGFVTGRAIK